MSWSTRIWLGLVTVFLVIMSVLLWRSEFGSRGQIASAVPPGVVWRKMLTAPDQSTLEIRQGTNRLGSCRWRPDVEQYAASDNGVFGEELIEGMVPRLASYTLDVDGNVAVEGFPTRIGFSAEMKLSTNFQWQTFSGRLRIRPDIYEVVIDMNEGTVHLRVDAGADQFDRRFTFAELQNPQPLLQEFGGPLLPAMIATLGLPLSSNAVSAAALAMRWEARNDSLPVGRNRLRAYRLQTTLLDRYKIVLFVSPVGEILRAELPGEIVLLNEQIAAFRQPRP